MPSAPLILPIRIEADAMTLRRHCEERSGEAIHLSPRCEMDCFAALAMTEAGERASLGRSSAPIDRMLPSRVPGERVSDQNIHQLGLRDSRRLPELWIHADGGKARQGVDLVHEDFFAFEEKVDASQPSAAKDLKCPDGKLPDTLRAFRRNIRGNDESGSL